MPLIRMDYDTATDGFRLSDPSMLDTPDAARRVVIMVHGYKFDPARADKTPHRHILDPRQDAAPARDMSWPRAMGFHGLTGEGLCIALGWPSLGGFAAAYRRAGDVGRALAPVIAGIRARHPRTEITVMGHSLGARVGLSALPHLRAGDVDRVIALSPADRIDTARSSMATPAGRTARVLAVHSRENDLYDAAMECALPSGTSRALGTGWAEAPANWCDVQIDCAQTLEVLARMDIDIAPPQRLICHWSSYTRSGVFDLYRAVAHGAIDPAALRTVLPSDSAPRWSRLIAPARAITPLSFGAKPSS